jgi:hypothetical protein
MEHWKKKRAGRPWGHSHGEVFWGLCRANGPDGRLGGVGTPTGDAGTPTGDHQGRPYHTRRLRIPCRVVGALVAARGALAPHLAGSGIQNTSPCETGDVGTPTGDHQGRPYHTRRAHSVYGRGDPGGRPSVSPRRARSVYGRGDPGGRPSVSSPCPLRVW